MELPKLILTDIDGVWTDGGMYYDEKGNELKKFHTYDAAGIVFSKLLGIPTGIITGEKTDIVQRRAKKLNIEIVYLGIKNKLPIVAEIAKELSISLQEIAYIGDDLNDLEVLKNVGFSAVVASAPEYMKKEVDFVTQKKGGDGAFREFVEHILKETGYLEEVLHRYKKIKFTQ